MQKVVNREPLHKDILNFADSKFSSNLNKNVDPSTELKLSEAKQTGEFKDHGFGVLENEKDGSVWWVEGDSIVRKYDDSYIDDIVNAYTEFKIGEKRAAQKIEEDLPVTYKELKKKPPSITEEEMKEMESSAEDATDAVKAVMETASRFYNEIADVEDAAKSMRKDVEDKIKSLKEERSYADIRGKLEDTGRQLGIVTGAINSVKRIVFRIGGALGIVEKKVEKVPVTISDKERLEKIFNYLDTNYPKVKASLDKHLQAVENGKQILATLKEELEILVIPMRKKESQLLEGAELDKLLDSIGNMLEDFESIEDDVIMLLE